MWKIKGSEIKLSKSFNTKGHQKGAQIKQTKQKDNNKKTPIQKNDYKYNWKKVPPKQGDKETQYMNNKTYHWRKWHKTWVKHDSEGKGTN